MAAETMPNEGSPVNVDKNTSLFEILLNAVCCVMCADKKITTQERQAVYKILKKTKSPWSTEEIDEKIGAFIQGVKKEG